MGVCPRGWSSPSVPLFLLLTLASAARADEPTVAPWPVPLPKSFDAPLCFERMREPGKYYEPNTVLVMVSRSGDKAYLGTTWFNTGRGEHALWSALWSGPATTPLDAMLAAVPEAARRALVKEYPNAERCDVQPIARGVDIAGASYQLRRVAGRYALVGEHYMTLLAMSEATPRWSVHAAPGVAIVSEGPEGWTSELIYGEMRNPTWFQVPASPDVAARAPKLVEGATPDIAPHDRRCLGWTAKTRAALVVRVESTCARKRGCFESKTLTEIGPNGARSRVSLAREGSDWPNMFGAANRIIARADLGCLAEGDELGPQPPWRLRFERDAVTQGLSVHVVGPTAAIHATTLERAEQETLLAVFWHPSVTAAVLEVQQSRESGRTSRFIWVDLAKLGVSAAPP